MRGDETADHLEVDRGRRLERGRKHFGVALGEPQNGALFNRLRGAVVCRAEHELAQRLAAKICGALQKRLDVRREARVEGRAAILFMRFCG